MRLPIIGMFVTANLRAIRSLAGGGIAAIAFGLGLAWALVGTSACASDGPVASSGIILPVSATPPRADSGLYQRALTEFSRGHHDRAVQLLRVLAEDGDRNAQFALGSIYTNGDLQAGVNRDLTAAASWYRRAAKPIRPGLATRIAPGLSKGT